MAVCLGCLRHFKGQWREFLTRCARSCALAGCMRSHPSALSEPATAVLSALPAAAPCPSLAAAAAGGLGRMHAQRQHRAKDTTALRTSALRSPRLFCLHVLTQCETISRAHGRSSVQWDNIRPRCIPCWQYPVFVTVVSSTLFCGAPSSDPPCRCFPARAVRSVCSVRHALSLCVALRALAAGSASLAAQEGHTRRVAARLSARSVVRTRCASCFVVLACPPIHGQRSSSPVVSRPSSIRA